MALEMLYFLLTASMAPAIAFSTSGLVYQTVYKNAKITNIDRVLESGTSASAKSCLLKCQKFPASPSVCWGVEYRMVGKVCRLLSGTGPSSWNTLTVTASGDSSSRILWLFKHARESAYFLSRFSDMLTSLCMKYPLEILAVA